GRQRARAELARRLGLSPVWHVTQIPLAEQFQASERFDCVLECTGRLDGWQQAFEYTAPGGQVLLFGGLPRGTTFAIDSHRLHYEEVKILSSFHFSPRDVAKARDLLLAGSLELDPLISGRMPLRDLPEALRRLESGEGLQYLIDPWDY